MPITIHNHWIDKLAVVAAFVSGFALYPQVHTIITSGSTDSVAMSTWIVIFLNSIVWIVYAIHRQLFALMLSTVFTLLASVAVIIWYMSI